MDEKLYTKTLNLPKTEFQMKGRLAKTEPQRIKKWREQKIYEKILNKNKSKTKFNMIDGPPYANGFIHLGHVLNKVLKDIIIKYKNLSGQYAPFVPFWDCHGLPIELKILDQIKKVEKSEEQDKKIRKLCKTEALKWVSIQSQEFQRLGIFSKWDEPCHTLDPTYEAEEIRILYKIHEKGLLQKGEKPVHWCPVLQTALASLEVEHKNHKSPSIYVKFYLDALEKKENEFFLNSIFKKNPSLKKISFVIWTTTPWTLPANQAIAVHPDLDYELFIFNNEGLFIAQKLKSHFQSTTNILLKTPKNEFIVKGKDLQGLKTKHPFILRSSPLILSRFVTLDAGTGVVHTAPGHGMDDYKLGLKYKLKALSPIDAAGNFTKEVPEYENQSLWKVNPQIIEKLKKSNHLLFSKNIEHSYPYNPRTQTPLIFRSTPQWFIKIDDKKYNLKKLALEATLKIEFLPPWGKERLKAMITNAPDWCLSRQRIWGVPIPILHCKKCNSPLVSKKIFHSLADLMEKTKQGFEVYHLSSIDRLLNGEKCVQCGNSDPENFEKEKSILDVWFDSGVSHTALMKKNKETDFPSDIYIEGSDQHRGWFQTSLFSALAYKGEPPYKKLITHGFVVDHKGYKMSKSKGNVMDPSKLINQFGADILRLWVIYEDYGQDLNMSEEIFQRVKETYRKFRNTFRFLIGNLYDFNPSKDMVDFEKMTLLDQWILHELNQLVGKSKAAYENYTFYKIYHLLNHFFTVDLSSFYLDVLKDRLYTWKSTSKARRSSQSAFYHLLHSLAALLSPILSFLAEEVHDFIPGEKKESVFLNSFPVKNSLWVLSAKTLEDLSFFFQLRSKVQKELEVQRKNKFLGSSLEAKVSIRMTAQDFERSKEYEDFLKEIFSVSAVKIEEKNEKNKTEIKINRADGKKCPRCWKYSKKITETKLSLKVCPQCIRSLN